MNTATVIAIAVAVVAELVTPKIRNRPIQILRRISAEARVEEIDRLEALNLRDAAAEVRFVEVEGATLDARKHGIGNRP